LIGLLLVGAILACSPVPPPSPTSPPTPPQPPPTAPAAKPSPPAASPAAAASPAPTQSPAPKPAASPAPSPAAATFPLTLTDDRGRAITLAAPPQRVVSLQPSTTEIACADGACSRIVATDDFSDFPDSVTGLPKLGGLNMSAEAIIGQRPDLVLTDSGTRADLVQQVEQAGLGCARHRRQELRRRLPQYRVDRAGDGHR
jgi:ABC-type Fe3+-hydroxamate transport system substrate-binding protein